MDAISQPLLLIALCGLAYAVGSILFAIPVCRFSGLTDPRGLGSRNPGATNVYRSGGPIPAGLTLLLDALKGAIPVWLAGYFGFSVFAQAMVALCAVTGHMVPVWYRFQGGKGVATALGSGLVLAPLTTTLLAMIWLVIIWRWRISALASVIAIGSGPVISALFEPETLPLFGLLAIVIVIRHRNNLIRLTQGRESRF
ncbi:glycerol-3-phosphate 1-O-acyltransferase PlsY [Marinobacter bryozoorum]|uniref:glycerol-3-phosphate 1-O-acyltransferase PlsY n=1 Tax=Marinobacter bryozoorum TaxID=256324 RepID=UPI00200303AD|nr:glycerol-3-phosphate 1-O-acyltransferase PlsY [Marinobacter bryozoorum]MCK7545569.1 glycerol-3-phosphate 1-O-acyltransferase PlsY [Marinobacter bryozoorum]